MNKEHKAKIAQVYSDCARLDKYSLTDYSKRDLDFKANFDLSVEDWEEAMKAANVLSYNGFDLEKVAAKLKGLNVRVIPAREGSVCVYLKGEKKDLNELKNFADEVNLQADGTLCLWWD